MMYFGIKEFLKKMLYGKAEGFFEKVLVLLEKGFMAILVVVAVLAVLRIVTGIVFRSRRRSILRRDDVSPRDKRRRR